MFQSFCCCNYTRQTVCRCSGAGTNCFGAQGGARKCRCGGWLRWSCFAQGGGLGVSLHVNTRHKLLINYLALFATCSLQLCKYLWQNSASTKISLFSGIQHQGLLWVHWRHWQPFQWSPALSGCSLVYFEENPQRENPPFF